MFLVKNTKSIVKRIAMNMAVYGFVSAFILMLLAGFIPEIIADYVYVLMIVCSVAAIIGAIIWVVSFFKEVVTVTKSYKESGKQPKTIQKCSLCGDSFSKIEMFNNKPYYYVCSSYYSSKYNINNGKLVDKKSGGVLLKEVILLAKPLRGCRGAIEPTDFIINLFTDKVEIVWGVGWRGGDSHADGAKGIEILEANYFEENTIDDFIAFLNTKHWGKDFVKWFNIKENNKIISLFNPLKSVIDKMINFLSYKNYDIEFANGEMAIVKHCDDPWNHFNKFTAKSDGVYNYVEVHMGGYDEKKRVSCCNFETACFLTLALFISREKLHIQESLILEIKQYANTVVDNSSDYWRGQFIIDELISLTKQYPLLLIAAQATIKESK